MTTKQTSSQVTITVGPGLVTFIQTWTVDDHQAQSAWLETMHTNVQLLRDKPGFHSLSLHRSLDGRQVVVYAQWHTMQDFQAATTDPVAVANHAKLAALGSSVEAFYLVDAVYAPSDRTSPSVIDLAD